MISTSTAMREFEVIIDLQNVCREFRIGGAVVRALRGVTLQVAAGEYLSIMGPSGSGKTTLFNMIGGLDVPSKGTVTVLGLEINSLTGSIV